MQNVPPTSGHVRLSFYTVVIEKFTILKITQKATIFGNYFFPRDMLQASLRLVTSLPLAPGACVQHAPPCPAELGYSTN